MTLTQLPNTDLTLPEFPGTITKVGWIPPEGNLPIEQWGFSLTGTLQIRRSIHFILGDMLNYGEHKYGQKYAQYLDRFDFTYGTLRNDCWVAYQIPIEHRRETLSWYHHYLVAKYDLETVIRVLDRAETRDWTSRQMDAIVKRWRSIFYNEGRKPLRDATFPAPKATSVLPLYVEVEHRPTKDYKPVPWKRMAKKQWRLSRAWRKRAIEAEQRIIELSRELSDLYDAMAEDAIIARQRDDGRLEKVL